MAWVRKLLGLPELSADEKGAILASIQKLGIAPAIEGIEDSNILSAFFKSFLPVTVPSSYLEGNDDALFNVRDELRDHLLALPERASLREFFQKPLPEHLRFPIPPPDFAQLPRNRSNIFRPAKDRESCRGILFYLESILREPMAVDTEESFHASYDLLIKAPVAFFYARPLDYRRNEATTESSLKCLRPDAVYAFGDGYVLFKGEEKGEDTEGDAAEELMDKDAWPYGDSVPYILAYHTRAYSVTFCVLYQEGRKTYRQDLQKFDIRVMEDRLAMFIACAKCVGLIRKLEPICERTKVKRMKKMKRDSGKVVEFYLEKVIKTYSSEAKAASACSIYTLIAGCPFVETAVHMNREKRHLVFECGTRVRPVSRQELFDCLVCILQALVWLHQRDIMHRDLRWPNIIKWSERIWWIVDFDEAAHSPNKGVVHLEKSSHAPEIEGRHDCKVDIWGVGYLLQNYTGPILSKGLRELSKRCLSSDPNARPSAAECLRLVQSEPL